MLRCVPVHAFTGVKTTMHRGVMMPRGEPNVARSASLFCVVFYGLLTFLLGVQCVARRSKDGMDEVVAL